MEDIQALRKPSDIPPVTLAELNDYSEGNKDKWINNHKIGTSMRFASDFRPDRIYYLATNVLNYTSREEMIGYIDPYNRGGEIFLPFYKRNIVTGKPTAKWEEYTTNFELGDHKKYAFIFYLGTNKRAERELESNQEDEERQARMGEEARVRQERMEEEARVRQERLRVAEKQGETVGLEGIQLKTKNPETGKWEGGRRTRRRRSTHRRRSLRNSSRKLNSRKLNSSKLKNKKSRKSRK